MGIITTLRQFVQINSLKLVYIRDNSFFYN